MEWYKVERRTTRWKRTVNPETVKGKGTHWQSQGQIQGVKPTIFCTANYYYFAFAIKLRLSGWQWVISKWIPSFLRCLFDTIFRAFVIKDNKYASVFFSLHKTDLIFCKCSPRYTHIETPRRHCSKWKIRLQHFILDDILTCHMDIRRRRQTGADICPPSWGGKKLTNEFSSKENLPWVHSCRWNSAQEEGRLT